jgi:hypothetical protein
MASYKKTINLNFMDGSSIKYYLKTDDDTLADLIKEINTDNQYIYSIFYPEIEHKLLYNTLLLKLLDHNFYCELFVLKENIKSDIFRNHKMLWNNIKKNNNIKTIFDVLHCNILDVTRVRNEELVEELDNYNVDVLFMNSDDDVADNDVTDNDDVDNDASDIEPLKYLTNLHKLALQSIDDIDLSPIKHLINLQELYIRISKFDTSDEDNIINQINIEPLKYLTNLHKLTLQSIDDIDLSPIKHLINLQELELIGFNIKDMTPLQYLPKLYKLSLLSCNLFCNTPFKYVPRLLEFCISYCNIENMTSLCYLQDLTNLSIIRCKYIVTIDGIQTLLNLQNLRIDHCKSLSDISFIRDLLNLRIIRITNCDNITDTSFIKDLPSIIDQLIY